MKIVNSLALLVAFSMQTPVADGQPPSVKVSHERATAVADVPVELPVAALEEVVGGLSRRGKCLALFGGVAVVGIAATIVTGGGAGILGGVIVGQIGKVGMAACLGL